MQILSRMTGKDNFLIPSNLEVVIKGISTIQNLSNDDLIVSENAIEKNVEIPLNNRSVIQFNGGLLLNNRGVVRYDKPTDVFLKTGNKSITIYVE